MLGHCRTRNREHGISTAAEWRDRLGSLQQEHMADLSDTEEHLMMEEDAEEWSSDAHEAAEVDDADGDVE